VTANLWVAVVLMAATVISSTFTYIQEGRASAVMKSFKNLLPRHAHVIRDGRLQDILARDLVEGDVVVVNTGDQVPADLRVIYQQEMKVEKSSLTGESLPVPVSTRAAPDDKLEEAPNVVFNTTKCTEGECVGVVIATGDHSMIGRIASLTSGTSNELTPIQKEVRHFVMCLAIFAFVLGLIFLAIGFGRGRNWIDAVIGSFIVVLIACVPEGLPLTVVSCLTITAKRMAKRNVFVKELRSVETLGSATVIASDKTGTLTMNKMTVSHIWMDFSPLSGDTVINDYFCLSPHYSFNSIEEHRRRHLGLVHSATLNALEIVAVTCNRARFEDEKQLSHAEVDVRESYQQVHGYRALKASRWRTAARVLSNRRFRGIAEDETRGVVGDGSDAALFNFMRQRQQVEVMRYHNRTVFELQFNSRNKFALCIIAPNEKVYARHTIVTDSHSTTDLEQELEGAQLPRRARVRCVSLGQKDIQEGEVAERPYARRVVVMKGAPEVVVGRCSHFMMRGLKQAIDKDFMEEFQAVYESFGSQVRAVGTNPTATATATQSHSRPLKATQLLRFLTPGRARAGVCLERARLEAVPPRDGLAVQLGQGDCLPQVTNTAPS
jgi:magnesium-transporting ATPase (P-type)